MAEQPTRVLIEHLPSADPAMCWRITIDDDLHCCAESIEAAARLIVRISPEWPNLDAQLLEVARRWQRERPEYFTAETQGGGDLSAPFVSAASKAITQALREDPEVHL